jgi:hypothetical protein
MGRRPKRGNPSLRYVFPAEGRQREVRRDFTNRYCYYFETANKDERERNVRDVSPHEVGWIP